MSLAKGSLAATAVAATLCLVGLVVFCSHQGGALRNGHATSTMEEKSDAASDAAFPTASNLAAHPNKGLRSDPIGPLDGSVISTSLGQLRGSIILDGRVEAFFGIPFAHPPTGKRRLLPPSYPPPSWKGMFEANRFGPGCIQDHTLLFKYGAGGGKPPPGMQLDEDCLYVNIHRPRGTTRDSKLPVVVWLHGGAFTFNTGATYNTTRFAEQGMVTVT